MRVRPDTISPEVWDSLDGAEQDMLLEQPHLHTKFWQDQLRELLVIAERPAMLAWRQVKHRTVQ
jgi:hypothetical protein